MPMAFNDNLPPNVSAGPTGGDMDIVGSHQRLLVAAALRTSGPILELGVGWYSTPILHEIARAQQRPLLTIDNNSDWLRQFQPLNSEFHKLRLVGWWGEMYDLVAKELGERIGLAFIDQGQPIEREYAIRNLLDKVGVFVMHDTEEGFAYGYSRTIPMFRHLFTDKCQAAWTTVASNEIDVSGWNIRELSPVKPTKDVT